MRVFFFRLADDERLSLSLIGQGKLLLAGLFVPAGFYWSRSELWVARVWATAIYIAISRSPLCDMYYYNSWQLYVYKYVLLCW